MIFQKRPNTVGARSTHIMRAMEDILHHIIEKGLRSLKTDIENAVNDNAGFVDACRAVCRAKSRYRPEYPHSLET